MYNFDIESKILNSNNIKYLGAIDEAGRGPLAGPVVSACVLIDKKFKISDELKEVKDSKKLSEKKRDKLYKVIYEEFIDIGIGICDNCTIDRINILQATLLSMKLAINNLKNRPSFVLIDGNASIPSLAIKQGLIPGGDGFVFSIAAASIVAKVTRDKIMKEYHLKFPQYGFDQNKGYGTKNHLEVLKKSGICEIHRKSFAPVKNL